MKKNKIIYYSFVAVYLATSIHYILGRIHSLGEYVLNKALLPEPIWKVLDLVYYKEAGGLKLLIAMAVLLLITIVIVAFYGKIISQITLTLSATLIIPPLVYIATSYFGNNEILVINSVLLCIVHTVVTAIFLIKDGQQINNI